jgi:hypothetical protein
MTDIQTSPTPSPIRSTTTARAAHIVTIVLLVAIAVLYIRVFSVQLPHLQEPDNPAPVYGFLALVYVVGATVYALRDTARVAWVLAALQVVVVSLFAWSVWLLYGHGDEAYILDMQGLAAAVTSTQLVVLALLLVRLLRRPGG